MSALLDDFLFRAGLAGVGVALAAGPLGCFVIWRRMAYFGEAAAHSALLGVALGLALQMPIMIGVLLVASAMALLVGSRPARTQFAPDAALGVYSHAALALGLVAISQMPGVRIDLMSYLFGDILAVGRTDLALLWSGAAVIGAALLWRWRALLNMTLGEELSVAEGGRPDIDRLALTLCLALVIAIGMQVVGLLLVTSMLILPAAAARPLAQTPEAMAIMAAGIGAAGAAGGLAASYHLDAPSGPMIVVTLFVVFCLAGLAQAVRRWAS